MSDTILAYEDYAQEPVSALYGPSDRPYRDYVSWLHEQTQSTAAPTDPATGTAWVATVDAGRWVAQCAGCHAGMVVTPTDPVTLCPLCPTDWAPVEFPSTQRRAFIERELLQIPGWRLSAPAREWTPTMTNLQLRERVVRALEVAATLQPGEQVRALSIGAARVWTVGEILTAANENTHISDVLDDLAGRNGPVELEDSLEVADGTGRFLGMPKGATTTRPAHGAGRARFNTTKNLPEYSDGSSWREMGNAPELTYETLNRANQVGVGASQVSRGNHTHVPSQPAAPSVASVSGENDRLAVSWVAPFAGSDPITSYKVAHSRAGMNAWTEVAASGSSHTLTGLAPNGRYDVRVAAANVVGVGLWSAVTTGRTNDGRIYALWQNESIGAKFLTIDADIQEAQTIPGVGLIKAGSGSTFFDGDWDGNKLYYITRSGHASRFNRLFSLNKDTGLSTAISTIFTGSGGDRPVSHGVAWDGTSLFTVTRPGNGVSTRLYTIDRTTGIATFVAGMSNPGNNYVGMLWNGTNLYLLTRESLTTVDRTTGSRTRVGSTLSLPAGTQGFVWDGARAYTSGRDNSLYTVDLSAGTVSRLGSVVGNLGIRTAFMAFVPA